MTHKIVRMAVFLFPLSLFLFAAMDGNPFGTALGYGGTLVFTSSNATTVSPVLDATSLTVSPNSITLDAGASYSFTVRVTDTSGSPTTPGGNVTFSDGNTGGTFTPTSCTLSSGTCSVSYGSSQSQQGTVTLTASYGGDSSHSAISGTATFTINHPHPTQTAIVSSASALPSNRTLSFKVTVTDTSNSPSTLSSQVIFSDGNAGGTFNPSACTLPASSCTSVYTAPVNPPNVITVNATYLGDSQHSASYAVSRISTNTLDSTATEVTPNPALAYPGNPIAFTATVSDNSSSASSMIGIISWGDGGSGGVFSPTNCILTENKCSVKYTPPGTLSGTITVTAVYAGDSAHSGSSGKASLSFQSQAVQPPATKNGTGQVPASPPVSTTPTLPTSPASPSQANPVPQPQSSVPSGNAQQSKPQQAQSESSSIQPNAGSSTPSGATGGQGQPVSSGQPSNANSGTALHPAPQSPPETQQEQGGSAGQENPPKESRSYAPTVSQIVNTPELIFDKIISAIASIFKKI